jgi:hypothetical protein
MFDGRLPGSFAVMSDLVALPMLTLRRPRSGHGLRGAIAPLLDFLA